MQTSGPFGQYAAIVGVLAAGLVLVAWLATAVGLAPASPQLDAIALMIVGALFGTGAGASVVANGVGREAHAANVRLDASGAPSAEQARRMVAGMTPDDPAQPPA
jgi:hypothetical protein